MTYQTPMRILKKIPPLREFTEDEQFINENILILPSIVIRRLLRYFHPETGKEYKVYSLRSPNSEKMKGNFFNYIFLFSFLLFYWEEEHFHFSGELMISDDMSRGFVYHVLLVPFTETFVLQKLVWLSRRSWNCSTFQVSFKFNIVFQKK